MLRIAVPDLVSNSYFPAIAAVELGFLNPRGMRRASICFPCTQNFRSVA